MKTTHKLQVDLTNPGQFLACCGLLELASCVGVDPEAVGWFTNETFNLDGADSTLLNQFVECQVTSDLEKKPPVASSETGDSSEAEKETKSPPIMLGKPFNLRLDWWGDHSAAKAGFKTWSAGMTVLGFFNGTPTGPSMRACLKPHLAAGEDLLQSTEAIEKPSPFNFDSRISRNIAIDLGFVKGVTFAFSPAVELLALVGLQRFRPRVPRAIDRWKRNLYHTWKSPLSVNVAAAVAHGLIPSLIENRYSFPIKGRDASARYKAFGTAQLERTSNV
jgi:CRISPR-associated protein Csb3